MIKYVLIAIVSGVLSSFSQVLLKKSSNIEQESKLKEYINPYVIVGYGITIFCMLLMVFAYKGLPYKYGSILESLAYLYIMVLSKLFLNERMTVRRVVGNIIIVLGVVVFNI